MRWTLYMAIAVSVVVATSSAVLADTLAHRHAVAFVAQAKIGENLPVIALSVATRTVTFAGIASKLGRADAIKAVSDEIDTLLPFYQAEWDENIAQAYEKLYTEEELSSLASEGRSSRYASKVVAQQSLMSKQMEPVAKPLLSALVSKALHATLSKNP